MTLLRRGRRRSTTAGREGFVQEGRSLIDYGMLATVIVLASIVALLGREVISPTTAPAPTATAPAVSEEPAASP
jgi:hypothetical protein